MGNLRLNPRYVKPSGPGSLHLRISDYGTDTGREARIQIARILRGKSFAINVNPLVKSEMTEVVGEFDNADEDSNWIQAAVVTSGIIIANAYWDGSDNTYVITNGQPVVFDTVTGRCVTGINPKWSPEEYVIVGTALLGFWPPGSPAFGRIPIHLGQQLLPDVIRYGQLTEDLLHGGEAEVTFKNFVSGRQFGETQGIGPMKITAGDPGQENSLLPVGKKLPSGAVVSMGLMTANGDPIWILLGSPTCPVDI